MSLLTPGYLSLVLTAIALAGCSAAPTEPDTFPLPTQIEINEQERSYHSSWGHSGRGGAALRKPAYQHVLATPDRLDTPAGRLYPAAEINIGTGTPDALPPLPALGASSEPSIRFGVARVPTTSLPVEGNGECQLAERVHVLARENVDEYIRVHNKLCAGSERLTHEEWRVLVNSTPRDVPQNLKVFPAPPTPPVTGKTNP